MNPTDHNFYLYANTLKDISKMCDQHNQSITQNCDTIPRSHRLLAVKPKRYMHVLSKRELYHACTIIQQILLINTAKTCTALFKKSVTQSQCEHKYQQKSAPKTLSCMQHRTLWRLLFHLLKEREIW